MKNKIYVFAFSILFFAACKELTPPPEPILIPERIEVIPENTAVSVGNTATFSAKMFDKMGNQVNPSPAFSWTSLNSSVATINAMGIATGIKAGQVQIQAELNGVKGTALLNVTENSNQIATISISPANPEITLNQTQQLTATAQNINGTILNGKNFAWSSSDASVVEVKNEGIALPVKYGTALITASSEGIQSNPVMVAVVRKGNFTGGSSYNVSGIGKLKIENNVLKLIFENNFVTSNGPDFRVYLSNSATGISGAIELAILQKPTGTQTYNVPATISITQYRYIVIWCKQFSVFVGSADLGTV